MPLVSVIIPCYNCVQYLAEAVESVCSQSLRDIEVVIVDDGSTDGSGLLIDSMAKIDERIKPVHQINSGPSNARNAGIDVATAPYLTFLDADDYIVDGALKAMYDVAVEKGVEVVAGGISTNPKVVKSKLNVERPKVKVKSGVEYTAKALYEGGISMQPGGKLFAKSLFTGDDRFKSGIMFEDVDLFSRLLPKVESVAVMPVDVYYYRLHGASFMQTWSEARLQVLDVTDRMVDNIERKHKQLITAARNRRFAAHFNMLIQLEKHSVSLPEVTDRCCDVIRTTRNEVLFDRRGRLKLRLGALSSYFGQNTVKLLCRFAAK